MKTALVLAFTLALSASSAFAGAPTATDQTDFSAINSACAQDAQTAGCSGEVVGKGLLKCLGQYKHTQRQTNKSFQYSAGCEAAVHQLRMDKKAGK